MRFVLVFYICFIGIFASAEDVTKAILNEPSTVAEKQSFTWNKWETDNFIILSIEKDQGLVLKRMVESIKDGHFSRWGMKSQEFPVKCKLVCVPDAEMLKKFFAIDLPKSEVRKNSSGDPTLYAIWIDFQRIDELPSLISSMCVSDKNKMYVQRGLTLLSLPANKIASEISATSQVKFSDFSSCLSDKWLSMSSQDKSLLDRNSAIVCLMLRKEFGEQKFLRFLSSNQDEVAIKSIYGFKDLGELDVTLGRYLENLKKDIGSGATPDSYLTVEGAEK